MTINRQQRKIELFATHKHVIMLEYTFIPIIFVTALHKNAINKRKVIYVGNSFFVGVKLFFARRRTCA